jgi:hypothetical protein
VGLIFWLPDSSQEVAMKWDAPAELTPAERKLVDRLGRKARFYVFLREIRGRLFDDAFQSELETAYQKTRGTAPLPAAMLAMVTLLQAYEQASDSDAVENAELDRRWQLVLGRLDHEDAGFSQGVLSQFRARMVAHDLDKKLLARTVELAKQTGAFGWQKLKFALDSSPLLGAGRVEDTWNLIGRALSTVVDCAAKTLARPRAEILHEAKLTLLSATSLKVALDINWDDETEKAGAMKRLLGEVSLLEAWVQTHAKAEADQPPLKEALAALRRVLEQDLEPDPGGGLKIRQGVAKDRMPSLGDKQMRHGRKSKTKLFNGYKRHIVTLEQDSLILGAAVLPANHPEHEAMGPVLDEAEQHGATETALIDRGYLASPRVIALRAAGKTVLCKPWPSRNGGRFTKESFKLDLANKTVECPAGAIATLSSKSLLAHFPAATCDACPKRAACTTARKGRGRTVSVHQQEEFLIELRALRRTHEGRVALRERVRVEHALAKLGAVQGNRARYKGMRRNELDVRRCAAVVNLQTVARLQRAA